MHLGKSKLAKILVVFLILSIQAFGQAGKSHKYRFAGGVQKTDVVSEDQSITIYYSLSELNIEELSNQNGLYYRLSIPGHSSTAEPGKPEIPVLSRLITIPEGSSYKIRISDVVSSKIVPSRNQLKGILFPSQYGETKQDQTRRPEFTIDKKLYATRGLIKSDTVRIEYTGKVRGTQLSNLIISPVRYNPGSNNIEVITSMKIEVLFYNTISAPSKSISSESLLFNESLGKGVLNYSPDDVITGYSDQPVEMIILTDTTFRKYLEPFFIWKRQKGYKLSILYKGGLQGQLH
jgi:hypothetical protein